MMNERERILDLVRQGVLSTDEGLELLENLAKQENKRMEAKEFDKEITTETEWDNYDETADYQQELEELANEMTQYSAELDRLNASITQQKQKRQAVKAELDQLKARAESEYTQAIEKQQDRLADLREELTLVQAIDEVDNHDEVANLKEKIQAREEQLVDLKEDAYEATEQMIDLEEDLQDIDQELAELDEEKRELSDELNSLKMRKWSTKAKEVTSQFDFSPDEWKEDTEKALKKAGQTVGSASKDLGELIKTTIESARGLFDNFEWSEQVIKVPTLASDSFDKEWIIAENPTILDFKNANGNISFESTTNEQMRISANITIYGKYDEATVEEAFAVRHQYAVDEDKLTFHIPNKRIKADIIVALPKQTYDYLTVNVLNGNISLSHIDLKDLYMKSTNGDFKLNKIKATMIEIKGTQGDIYQKDVDIQDLIINTVNGDIQIRGDVISSALTTTNGDIRMTLFNPEATQLEAITVNGDVKVALPSTSDIDVEGKAAFGKVKSRLNDVEEDPNGKKNFRSFKRLKYGNPMTVQAKTTSGSIYFKDTDEKVGNSDEA